MNELEEGTGLGLDFGKLASVAAAGADVVPAVLQDADSGEVLFIGYVSEQNSLLYLVRRTTGGACHTLSDSGSARPSCYYRMITDELTLRPAGSG